MAREFGSNVSAMAYDLQMHHTPATMRVFGSRVEPLLAYRHTNQVMKPKHLAPLLSNPPPVLVSTEETYVYPRARSLSRRPGERGRKLLPSSGFGGKLVPLPPGKPQPPQAEPAAASAPTAHEGIQPALPVPPAQGPGPVAVPAAPPASAPGPRAPQVPMPAVPYSAEGTPRPPAEPMPRHLPHRPSPRVPPPVARSPGAGSPPSPQVPSAAKLAESVYGAPVVPGLPRPSARGRRRPAPLLRLQPDAPSAAPNPEPPAAGAVAALDLPPAPTANSPAAAAVAPRQQEEGDFDDVDHPLVLDIMAGSIVKGVIQVELEEYIREEEDDITLDVEEYE